MSSRQSNWLFSSRSLLTWTVRHRLMFAFKRTIHSILHNNITSETFYSSHDTLKSLYECTLILTTMSTVCDEHVLLFGGTCAFIDVMFTWLVAQHDNSHTFIVDGYQTRRNIVNNNKNYFVRLVHSFDWSLFFWCT